MSKNARNTDPSSSHLYANGGENRAVIQEEAVALVCDNPGLTAREIGTLFNRTRPEYGHEQVRRRLSDAKREGEIILGAQRECTVSGRTVCTWLPVTE